MSKKFVLNYLMSQIWALDASLLSVMGNIANRQFSEDELSDILDLNLEALEGKKGVAIAPLLEMRDRVAVISIKGVISRYASWFHAICGGTSTQLLAQSFTKAIDDPAVRAIALNIDSPGGEANGIHEFSEMVYQGRSRKPITAYVGGDGCSAAYWIASAAHEVVMDATSRVGSIGVVSTIWRRKSADSNIETLEIVSSQSPNKRLDPFTDKGREEYQARIDEFADIFIDRVARNRAVNRDKVLSDFGQGGVLIGKKAVKQKMANRLGSLEGVIAELKSGKIMQTKNKVIAEGEELISSSALPTAEHLNASDFIAALKEERPDVLKALEPEPEESALSAAEAIAKACTDANMPALSAALLKDGVSKSHAEQTIKSASRLRDKLAAAGLTQSFEKLVGHIDDPIQLVGLAIHEAQALLDENSDSSRHIVNQSLGNKPSINSTEIYAKRRGMRT